MSQTRVGNGDATFSLESTGRTVRSLSAGSYCYLLLCELAVHLYCGIAVRCRTCSQ